MKIYEIEKCCFYDFGNTFATLRDENLELCEFQTRELAEKFLKEIQSHGEKCLENLAYLYLDRDWIEVYAFKGYFYNNWVIILQRANNFFGKKNISINLFQL